MQGRREESRLYTVSPCVQKNELLPYNKVRANAGVARTNNRDKNQNWMVFRIEVSGANTNNRNSVA